MPIRVKCPACQAALSVRDPLAGKRVKCPRCKAGIEVPGTDKAAGPVPVGTPAPRERVNGDIQADAYGLADAASKVRALPVRHSGAGGMSRVAKVLEPTRRSKTPAQILAAFRGTIEPVRPTPIYLAWIAVVAALMVLLPVLYVAFVGLVGVLVLLHAVYDVGLFEKVHPRLAIGLYVGPIVGGVVAVAFLLKPLFARPAQQAKAQALDPSVEPLVFAFVDGICQAVGAPRPARIEVDSQVNASAHRAGGALSIFNNDLVLTIGLPLVAGLNFQQFAGVLAHEFGHFSQGAGMRLSTLIRAINGWFARLVYERDAWDAMLLARSSQEHHFTMGLAMVGLAAVWICRRVLWVLMVLGHAASGFLLRQMEFDADRYEARLVGGEIFTQTVRRLRILNLAAEGAYADLTASWQERRLPDDLTKLILANVAQIPEPVLHAIREAEAQGCTGLFDTHPADNQRIARACAEAAEGIFTLRGPATDLFHDFDALARWSTFHHYRALLGAEITRDQLYPVADAVQGQAAIQQGHEAFARFFLKAFGAFQPLPLAAAYPSAPADLKAAETAVVSARSWMVGRREGNVTVLKQWDEVQDRAVKAGAAVALLKAGGKINAADFDLDDRTLSAAVAALECAEGDFRELIASLTPFSTAAARRIEYALGLLERDDVAARVSDGPARRAEARALYPCAAYLGGRLVGELPPVLWAQNTVVDVAQRFTRKRAANDPAMASGLLLALSLLHERVASLRGKMGDSFLYPFEHAEEGISLRRFVLPTVPPKEAIGDLTQAAGEALERVVTVYSRVLGRLAVTAEEVEHALGLSPLSSGEEDGAEGVD